MGEPLESVASFFEATRRRIRRLRVGSLGEDVFIKPLTGIERARIGDAWRELREKASFEETSRRIGYQTIAMALVDRQGRRIFSDAEINLVGEIDAAALDEISAAI